MIKVSLPLKLTRGQIPIIQTRMIRQMQAYQELLILSCEMFEELYEHKPNTLLLQRWHSIIQDLLV